MYLPEANKVPFVSAFMYLLQNVEIENPKILATQYGGVVRNEVVHITVNATFH